MCFLSNVLNSLNIYCKARKVFHTMAGAFRCLTLCNPQNPTLNSTHVCASTSTSTHALPTSTRARAHVRLSGVIRCITLVYVCMVLCLLCSGRMRRLGAAACGIGSEVRRLICATSLRCVEDALPSTNLAGRNKHAVCHHLCPCIPLSGWSVCMMLIIVCMVLSFVASAMRCFGPLLFILACLSL